MKTTPESRAKMRRKMDPPIGYLLTESEARVLLDDLDAAINALRLSEKARKLGCDCRSIGNEADAFYAAEEAADD
jgi:hypothetical protein